MAGVEDVVIVGGTEMMSGYKANASRNRSPFMDNGNLHLRGLHPQTNQGVAADAIATLEGIDRRAVDELAAESQRRAEIAIKEGRFDKSLVPVRHHDGSIALDHDEYPRPGTTRGVACRRCRRRSRRWPTWRSKTTASRTAT